MPKPSLPNRIKAEILLLTTKLVKEGIASDQNYPCQINIKGGGCVISWNSQQSISPSLKNVDYRDVYKRIFEERNYNIRLLDGSLIQILYTFDRTHNLMAHRLSYFPCPDIDEFMEESSIGGDEGIDDGYQDFTQGTSLILPLRFDFGINNHVDVKHPKSHIHLGNYQNCRIPLSAPVSPNMFLDFILRNFYSKIYYSTFTGSDFEFVSVLPKTITKSESRVVHLNFDI